MLLVAEVVGQLAVAGALDESLGELLKEPVLVEQVLGLLIILQQLIEQFGSNRWHNLVLSKRNIDCHHLHRL